jgi:hypothetical protein
VAADWGGQQMNHLDATVNGKSFNYNLGETIIAASFGGLGGFTGQFMIGSIAKNIGVEEALKDESVYIVGGTIQGVAGFMTGWFAGQYPEQDSSASANNPARQRDRFVR